ncbi:hypothetical protein [Spiroplasma endosymbiont of Dactylopius coccus]|nr:hypothetical protein [Spiroplasma ixodetis]
MKKQIIAENIRLHNLQYYKEMKIKDLVKMSQFDLVNNFIHILECIILSLELDTEDSNGDI